MSTQKLLKSSNDPMAALTDELKQVASKFDVRLDDMRRYAEADCEVAHDLIIGMPKIPRTLDAETGEDLQVHLLKARQGEAIQPPFELNWESGRETNRRG